MQQRSSVWGLGRAGLALLQGLMGVFAAGSVIAGAHHLFLRYYANEWGGIQLVGVNDCSYVDRIANGDLIEGQTFCNRPENFVPWIEIYRRHPAAAALYYGAALTLILVMGIIWAQVQKRLGTPSPFGAAQVPHAPADSEHLR